MELFDNLNEIKSQLFDAPDSIKSDFNNIVKYFNYDNFLIDSLMHLCDVYTYPKVLSALKGLAKDANYE